MGLFDAGSHGRDAASMVVHDRVWTAANVITFVRLLGLPLFVWLVVGPQAYGQAFAVLVAVAVTDWVDGYVARRFDQVTRLGKWLDPLMDRLLIATAGITLAVVGFLPLWLLLAVVVRDVVVLGAAAIMFRGAPPIPVSRTGKFATACLLIGVPGFLLANMDWAGADLLRVASWSVMVLGIAAYYLAGLRYAQAAIGLRPRGGPSDDRPPSEPSRSKPPAG